MNRRRFLSMLGVLPAVLAMPSVVAQSSKVTVTNPSVTSVAQDIKYGQLVKVHGPEVFLPLPTKTREEETVDAIFRFHDAVKELTRVEERYGFKFLGWLPQ